VALSDHRFPEFNKLTIRSTGGLNRPREKSDGSRRDRAGYGEMYLPACHDPHTRLNLAGETIFLKICRDKL
jgi:hypothetical protein